MSRHVEWCIGTGNLELFLKLVHGGRRGGLIFDNDIEEISGNIESNEHNYCENLDTNSPTVHIAAKQTPEGQKNTWSSFFQKKHAPAKDKSTPSENKSIPKKSDNLNHFESLNVAKHRFFGLFTASGF